MLQSVRLFLTANWISRHFQLILALHYFKLKFYKRFWLSIRNNIRSISLIIHGYNFSFLRKLKKTRVHFYINLCRLFPKKTTKVISIFILKLNYFWADFRQLLNFKPNLNFNPTTPNTTCNKSCWFLPGVSPPEKRNKNESWLWPPKIEIYIVYGLRVSIHNRVYRPVLCTCFVIGGCDLWMQFLRETTEMPPHIGCEF